MSNENSNPIIEFAKSLLSGNNLFKNSINGTNPLSNKNKKIFINTYYIPMLYLLYSYYYTKFYKIQKLKIFRIENKFNYDNITLLFDKQNPAMKKINVYLFENFKKGKIEKLAPIDENISGDIIEKKETVIKFLENINKVLEKNIDLINERLKKDNQIVYDLNQYLKHLMKLYDLIYQSGQTGGANKIFQKRKEYENAAKKSSQIENIKKARNKERNNEMKAVIDLQKVKKAREVLGKALSNKLKSLSPQVASPSASSNTGSSTSSSAGSSPSPAIISTSQSAASSPSPAITSTSQSAGSSPSPAITSTSQSAASSNTSSSILSKLKVFLFTKNYISQFIVSHEKIISNLLTDDKLNNIITEINKFPIDKLKNFLIKIGNENELNNFIKKMENNQKTNTMEKKQQSNTMENKQQPNTMESTIYKIIEDNKEVLVFKFIKDIFEQKYVSQSNIQEGGSNYYERVKNLLEILKGLDQDKFNQIKNNDKDIDYDSDILDILKTMDKPNKLDDIYLNYKEAVRLINNTNIDLILRNEYDKEEDIITRINFNSIYIVSKIIENINEKVILNNKNKEKYRIFINKNDKLIDLLDNEKELIKGFLEKIKEDKITPQLSKNYKSKFDKIKAEIFNLFTNISFNEKNIDNEKNNLEDLLNIIYRSIYINEKIEYNYLNLKLNEKLTDNQNKSKDRPIIDYEFYIDNILQRYKKEKKDKTKLIDKTMEIFKKDMQDLKKKITTDKEIHERESNVIAQKSKNIIKIEADKKKEIEEERKRESEILQLKKKLENKSKYSNSGTKKVINNIKLLSSLSVNPNPWKGSTRFPTQNYNITTQENIDKAISKIITNGSNKIYKDNIAKLASLEKISTSRVNKNDVKKKLEKNIEDYKKLKGLIEYKIKQIDDILLNISIKKAEFNKKDKEEINFDEFKESYLSTFQALADISKKVKDINSKIELNNSKNRLYILLKSDSINKLIENNQVHQEQKKQDQQEQDKKQEQSYKSFINKIKEIIYIKFNKKIIENKQLVSKLKATEGSFFITKLNKEIEIFKDMSSDVQLFFKKINSIDTEIWETIRSIVEEIKLKKLNKNTTITIDNIYKKKYEIYKKYMNTIDQNTNNKPKSEYIKLIPYTDCIYMYFLNLFSIIDCLTSNL
jgi:hypothetical protein